MGENQGMPMLRCNNRIPRLMKYAYIIFIMLVFASCKTSRSVTKNEQVTETNTEVSDTTVTEESNSTAITETRDSTDTNVHIEETEYDTTVTDENGEHPVKKKKVTDINKKQGASQVTTNETKAQHTESGHRSGTSKKKGKAKEVRNTKNEAIPKPTLLLITAIIFLIIAPRLRDTGRWLLSLFLNR